MIGTEPQVSKSGYYSVAEASRLMGCDYRTLNKYAAYFRVTPHINKVTKRLFYKGDQLLKIWRAAF